MTRCGFLLLLCLSFVAQTTSGQTDKMIRDLESRRTELQRQIAETESLLNNNRRDVGSRLNALNLLSAQVAERRRLTDSIAADIMAMDSVAQRLDLQLDSLGKALDVRRHEYEATVRYIYRNRNVQDKIMFILSADKLAQMYRRLRYVRQFGTYQRQQGEALVQQQQQVSAKRDELRRVRSEKDALLAVQQDERRKIESQEQEQQKIVSELRSQQRALQADISKKRRQAEALNKEIDNRIAAEIERQRKEAEAAQRAKAKTTTPRSDSQASVKAKNKTAATTSPSRSDGYNAAAPDRQLSSNFASNKGRLPLPITGPYIITSHYGQYNVQGLRNVTLDNKGIDIQGKSGAQARAVFDGTVVAIFKLNGLFNVLVRHGEYISVYCNLSSTTVHQGDAVTARQTLGPVFSDSADGGRTTLHFQLRRETEKLNPEVWLGK